MSSIKSSRQKKVPPARRLGVLAMDFRGARDESKRESIAQAYSQAVAELIDSNKWKCIPLLEEQLPDEWMPEAFFTYWSLRPPLRRAGNPTNYP
jgi:hypothetical protein